MTYLVPIMLFGWVPLSILFFSTLKPHHAALVCIIGGMLFLPMAGYNFSGFPEYDKSNCNRLRVGPGRPTFRAEAGYYFKSQNL